MTTPLERLKALTAAKKAAEAKETKDATAPVPPVQELLPSEVSSEPVQASQPKPAPQIEEVAAYATESAEDSGQVEVQAVVASALEEDGGTSEQSDCPILMELAELEQQLNDKIPDFRHTLRNIHQKLRQDPEIVTLMTDEQIGLVFKGLLEHANAEIIAPKAVKAARAAAKKPVSADDL